MTRKLTKALTEQLEGILQRGEPMPSDYVFNPRHDPPLYKRDSKEAKAAAEKKGSQIAAVEIVDGNSDGE